MTPTPRRPAQPTLAHRHLVDHDYWSKPRIDDVLDRGGFPDWLALRDAIQADRNVAQATLEVAASTNRYGTSPLWIGYVTALYPDLAIER